MPGPQKQSKFASLRLSFFTFEHVGVKHSAMDMNTMIIGFLASSLGLGYFIYGKKQQLFVPMVAGGALCAIPFFIDNLVVLAIACLVAMIAPFILKF
jgi:hypothetical protein